MHAVSRSPRPCYGWVAAGVTLALLAVAAGAPSAPTMLIRPLEGEFGWTTGTISLAIGINIALFGLGGLFAIHQVGSGLTAFGAGETRTLVGGYGPALMVAVAMCAAASIKFMILRTGSKRLPAERTA